MQKSLHFCYWDKYVFATPDPSADYKRTQEIHNFYFHIRVFNYVKYKTFLVLLNWYNRNTNFSCLFLVTNWGENQKRVIIFITTPWIYKKEITNSNDISLNRIAFSLRRSENCILNFASKVAKKFNNCETNNAKQENWLYLRYNQIFTSSPNQKNNKPRYLQSSGSASS